MKFPVFGRLGQKTKRLEFVMFFVTLTYIWIIFECTNIVLGESKTTTYFKGARRECDSEAS